MVVKKQKYPSEQKPDSLRPCDLRSTRSPNHKPFNNVSLPSTRGMFAGGLRETQQKEIQIHGVSYMAMTKIIDYIYTSEIELDLECVQDVLNAATLVQVHPSNHLGDGGIHFGGVSSANLCPFVL